MSVFKIGGEPIQHDFAAGWDVSRSIITLDLDTQSTHSRFVRHWDFRAYLEVDTTDDFHIEGLFAWCYRGKPDAAPPYDALPAGNYPIPMDLWLSGSGHGHRCKLGAEEILFARAAVHLEADKLAVVDLYIYEGEGGYTPENLIMVRGVILPLDLFDTAPKVSDGK